VAVSGRPCLVNSWRISHFGAKPVRGGRPPSERRTSGAKPARAGTLDHAAPRELTLVELEALNVRKAEEVIIIYVDSARMLREGLNWRTRIIQPKWAIDEYARTLRS